MARLVTVPADWPDIAHMSREELEAEVAALRHALNAQRDELAKVKGHRAELSERSRPRWLDRLDEPAIDGLYFAYADLWHRFRARFPIPSPSIFRVGFE